LLYFGHLPVVISRGCSATSAETVLACVQMCGELVVEAERGAK
jgi:hypothetical protein